MKQTAVEHLQEYLTISLGIDRMRLLFNEFEKAKEMEKEQKIEFAKNCLQENDCFFDIEKYYNQTFKSE